MSFKSSMDQLGHTSQGEASVAEMVFVPLQQGDSDLVAGPIDEQDIDINDNKLEEDFEDRNDELSGKKHFRRHNGIFLPKDEFQPDMDSSYEAGKSFEGTWPERPRLAASFLELMQKGNKKYALRDIDRHSFRGSGWLDRDKSGDYDPTIKKSGAFRPNRAKVLRPLEPRGHNCDEAASEPRDQKAISYEQGRRIGRRKILSLKFSSKEALENFQTWVEVHPSSDHIHSSNIVDTGMSTRKQVLTTRCKAKEVLSNDSEESYEHLVGHLEARGCRGCYDLGLECSLVNNGQDYPCGNCEQDEDDCILITPPARKRTCELCRLRRKACSYSKDGGVGVVVCENCPEVNAQCIAGPAGSRRIDDIITSTSKGKPSSTSTFRRQHFAQTGSSTGDVQDCIEVKPKCQLDTSQTNSHSSIPFQGFPAAPKSFHKQTPSQCLTPRKRPKRLIPQPRNHSRTDINKKRRLEKPSNRKSKSYSFFRPKHPTPTHKPTVGGGKLLYITTSYCHPISFNWVPPPPLSPSPYLQSPLSSPRLPLSSNLAYRHHRSLDSSFPCHFCTSPGLPYALAGLGSLRVEVIEWDASTAKSADGSQPGYEEIEGGWSEKGEENSRMCIECTMERMLICLCRGHEIRPIEGLDPGSFDFDAALLSVLKRTRGGASAAVLDQGDGYNDSERNNKEEEVKWCSVCIMPAFYECCVLPAFTKAGFPTDPSIDNFGCGLLLCEVCALRMVGSSQYLHNSHAPGPVGAATPVKAQITLDTHIASASKDPFHYPDGLRADVCFLATDGEMMQRLGGGTPTETSPGPHPDSDTYSNYPEVDLDLLDDAFEGYGPNNNPGDVFYSDENEDGDTDEEYLKLLKVEFGSEDEDTKSTVVVKKKKNRALQSEDVKTARAGVGIRREKRRDTGIKKGSWGMAEIIDLT